MNTITNSRPLTSLSTVLSLSNQRLFGFAVLLSVAPLWFGSYLPLVDLPQHAAQVGALHELWSGNALLAEQFRINWFTPYLLGYLLLYALSLVVPITVAAQLLVTASVAAIPLATGALLRAGGADERWKWLAIPCSFSFAFYWGFLSFIVSVPLVLLFLISTMRFVEAPTLRRGCGIAAFAVLLFFCHIMVLGFASLVALSYLCARTLPRWRALVVMALPYTAPIPLIVFWLIRTITQESSVQENSTRFAPLMWHLYHLLSAPAGREMIGKLSVVVTVAVALLPMLAGARITRRPERVLPFCCALVVLVAVPHYAMGTAYLFERMGIFLVPFWLLMWDRPTNQRMPVEWLAMAVVTAWCLSNAARFASFAKEVQSFRAVMAHTQPGKRLAGIVVAKWSPLFSFPVYLHFPSWYQAERQGIADFNFGDFLPQMVRFKAGAPPRIDESAAWSAELFDWERNGGANYDYFLIKFAADISNPVFKDKRSSLELVAQSGDWWLYENRERAAASETSARTESAQQ